jgi:hypothetical protein
VNPIWTFTSIYIYRPGISSFCPGVVVYLLRHIYVYMLVPDVSQLGIYQSWMILDWAQTVFLPEQFCVEEEFYPTAFYAAST